MRNLLANLLISLGLILLLGSVFLIWQRYNPRRLAFDGINEIEFSGNKDGVNTRPITLSISDLGVYLPVIPANNTGGKWETTTKGVSYLIDSANPGEVGNSIFYGHNWESILGNLTDALPGQEIEITFSDGSVKYFDIKYTQEVSPKQVDIVKESSDRRLTLYTCSGFLDTKRFVVTAELI